MDVSDILDALNDAQREAVSAPLGNTLVLAAAGSGKTRVLVHRIAWLIRVENASPFGILAVTFTNKAAKEMRLRTEALLKMPITGMWIGTFHGIAHRFLRRHWQEAGLTDNFQILDAQDQQRMIKRVLKELNLDEANWPPKQAAWYINARKEEGLRAENIPDEGSAKDRQFRQIYHSYQKLCRSLGVVDFAELLLLMLEVLRNNQELKAHYQQRLQHILVDEFQDTNHLQYELLKLLAGEQQNPPPHAKTLFVVGDDDQSIYSWRGARIENIQQFSKQLHAVTTLRLQQNYRSSGAILKAANALIRYNTKRLGKELWTEMAEGNPIDVYAAYNETDEARFIAERIQQWIHSGGSGSDVAILYRSNAQSRVFEETFIALGIAYRVYGGLRFFERAEIKDALAYLRLSSHRDDDASFERIINQPPRGIGERTVDSIRATAQAEGSSLWAATLSSLHQEKLTPRAATAIRGFIQIIDGLREDSKTLTLEEQVDLAINSSGLLEFYRASRTEKAQARRENLQELVSAAKAFSNDFIPDAQTEQFAPLDNFLAHAALEAGETVTDDASNCVQMMTLHAAKGLEFPLVFLCGLEEGLFPHQMSISEDNRLEEERRLCYVGITRAQQQLVISYAEKRRLYGREQYALPSRFIAELPHQVLQEVRPRVMVSRPMPAAAIPKVRSTSDEDGRDIDIGKRVLHRKFGEGVVINCEGNGQHARVQVNFADAGSKWLVLAYAGLEVV